MQLQPRTEAFEYGSLPLHALCPQLDGHTTLLAMHKRLLAKSTANSAGQRLISPQDVAVALELTSSQIDVLAEVVNALSVLNRAPGTEWPAPGSEQLFVHEVTYFLFVQLYNKEAQRPDNQEVWPEAAALQPGFGPSPMDLLSPTRSFSRSNSSSKSLLRQQLQQHLRNQVHAMRGFGDYIRRNLKLLVELSLDKLPANAGAPQAAGSSGSGGATGSSGSGGATAGAEVAYITAQEADRLRFLVQPPRQRQSTPLSSLIAGLSTPGASLPLETVVTILRALWHEETVDSPRLSNLSPMQHAAALGSSPSPRAQRQLGLVGPSGHVDDSSVTGLHKGTVVRGEGDVPGGVLRITDCHEAIVYALAPLQAVYISGCSDCMVVIGAAGRVVRMERCDKVQLVAAAARVLVANCHDCSLYLGTPRPPLLVGDCRFIKLAPFNTRYEKQLSHLRDARLRLDQGNLWDAPLLLAGKDRRSLSASGSGLSPESPRASSVNMTSLAMQSSLLPFSSASSGPNSFSNNNASPAFDQHGRSRANSTGSTGGSGVSNATFSLLSPDEFLPFVIPFQGGAGVLAGGPAPPHTTAWRHMAASVSRSSAAGSLGSQQLQGMGDAAGSQPGPGAAPLTYLFPLPPEYERALHKKLTMTAELRQRFRAAGLTKEREAELNNAIQAYFKEWLATGNMLRQIYDLSNLERDEFAVAGSGGSNGAAAGAAANAAIASASGQPMHGITGAGANQDGAKEKVMLSL